MRVLGRILASLLPEKQAAELRLQRQYYLLILPKALLEKEGIFSDEINFELVVDSDKLALIGPNLSRNQSKSETTHFTNEVIAT